MHPKNPKKQIMHFLADPACRQPAWETCELCEQVRRIMEGMSEGTATLVIEDAVRKKIEGDYAVEGLANKGRYYTASIVNHDGTLIQKLLVDKQTGDVRFV
jgi:hypothetical protein